MELTTIEQDRNEVLLPDGTKRYRIRTSVLAVGELPQLQIFVFEIKDAVDPSLDAFIRIGTPYDLDTFSPDRVTAVANGDAYYLSAEFMQDYRDLQLAVTAKDAIYSALDTLTNTWYTYTTSFQGADDESAHPSVSASYEQQLIDTYADAKETRVEAEAALVTATTDLTLSQADAASAAEITALYKNEKDFCTEFGSTWTSYKAMVDSWYVAYSVSSADQASATALADMLESIRNTFCNNAASQYSLAVNAQNAAESEVQTKVLAKKEAEAEVTSALAAEAAALSAVLNICPDFDPLSV